MSAASGEIEFTEAELREQAEALARRVGIASAEEAWRRVQAGEFEGTLLAQKLTQIRLLLGDD